ncbi:MAG: hypothetical protein KDA32_08015 [Phycisphaerales bacterium]|nr:hypothetical protein [Phycisphaerales bacterium]
MTRRALTLGLTLVCLAIMAAMITPLALLSGVESLEANFAADGLAHRLAGDSVIRILPRLIPSQSAQDALDRDNRWLFETTIGATRAQVLIQDDSAKLPLQALVDLTDPVRIEAALARVAPGLPVLTVRRAAERARVARCLEETFALDDDAALYGRPDTDAWTRYITPVGARINVQRASAVALEALFDDNSTLAQRLRDKAKPQLTDVTQAERQRVEAVTTSRPERYSLLIRTTLHGQARQRYVIIDAGASPTVSLDLEVAP